MVTKIEEIIKEVSSSVESISEKIEDFFSYIQKMEIIINSCSSDETNEECRRMNEIITKGMNDVGFDFAKVQKSLNNNNIT